MKLFNLSFKFALACAAVCATSAQALTITSAGSNVDLGSGWRTASVAKNDIDGNNVLGSDGYFIVGNNQRTKFPFYLTNLTDAGISTFGGNGGYASIDDPNTTPGGAPTLIGTGTKNPFPGVNVEAKVFSFDVKAGAPSTFRVGVLLDNTDGTQFTSNGVRLVQTVGGAANSGLINTSTVNRTPDWFYFDVTGAVAGDRIEVRSAGSSSGCACVGGLAFDNIGGPIVLDPTKLWSVDIQGTGTPATMSGIANLYGEGNVWNAFNVAHHAGTSVNPSANLVSSNGAASPVNFAITGTVSGFNNGSPDALTRDYLFINAGGASANITWQLTGLEANGLYEMFVYGGAIGGRDFNMAIDLDGDGSLLDEVARNVGTAGTLFELIRADGAGRIIGNALNNAREGNWAGFQLRQLVAPVPEPASLSLLVIGGAALLRRRRAA